MSMGVMRTVPSSVQRRQDHPLDELYGDDDDQRREVEASRPPRRQEDAPAPQQRLGGLEEELDDGVAGVRAHPRDEGGGDDHVGVEIQQPADELDEVVG